MFSLVMTFYFYCNTENAYACIIWHLWLLHQIRLSLFLHLDIFPKQKVPLSPYPLAVCSTGVLSTVVGAVFN